MSFTSPRLVTFPVNKSSMHQNDLLRREFTTNTILMANKDPKEFTLTEISNKPPISNTIGSLVDSSTPGLRLLTNSSYQTNNTIPSICQVS